MDALDGCEHSDNWAPVSYTPSEETIPWLACRNSFIVLNLPVIYSSILKLCEVGVAVIIS